MYPNYMMPQMGQMGQQMPQIGQFGQNQYQMPKKDNLEWINVNGIQGARDVQIQANQTAWLMDMNEPIFYVKKADGMGVCTLEAYRFEKINPEQPKMQEQMFATKDELNTIRSEIRALQEVLKNESVAE